MLSNNKIIVASAGSGKTTEIINLASADKSNRAAIITYTINGREEILKKIYSKFGFIPPHITVDTWYTFMLKHFVRPYQNVLYKSRVQGIHFVNARSDIYSKSSDIARHYFSKNNLIYSDKVTKFSCELIQAFDKASIIRFEQIFGRLYVDEAQDLAGYDLDLIETIMRSSVQVTLVGDHRQSTYATNCGPKHVNFRGDKIINKFELWHAAGLCDIEYQNYSYRCIQPICDFADQFHSVKHKTQSHNSEQTGHDGLFAIQKNQVEDYCNRFNPQPLRYNRLTMTFGKAYNYGESKGMTFDRTLIYPHKPLLNFLKTGIVSDAGKELDKIYVAITRAKHSVAFVVNDFSPLIGVIHYECS